jgi:hypothetical protein
MEENSKSGVTLGLGRVSLILSLVTGAGFALFVNRVFATDAFIHSQGQPLAPSWIAVVIALVALILAVVGQFRESRKLWPILGLLASLILLLVSAFVWLIFGSMIA